MGEQPRVSVVIPVFNRPAFVKRAVASALGQTFGDQEIIVVDDGSTDETPAVLESFGPRITVLAQANRGAYAARNLAVGRARGEFVAFLDSDDEWMPSKLALQVPRLEAQPDVGLVFGDGEMVDGGGRIEATFFSQGPPARGLVFHALLARTFVPTSSVVVRRSRLAAAGPFVEVAMGGDYHKWLQLSRVCAFDYVDEVVFRYTNHEGNASRDRSRRYEDLFRLFDDLAASIEDGDDRQALLRRRRELEYEFGLMRFREGLGRLGRALAVGGGLPWSDRIGALARVLWTHAPGRRRQPTPRKPVEISREQMPDVVLTGITGRLGRSVAPALAAAGYRVIGLTRQTTGERLADELLRISTFDDLPRLTSAPAAVVHLAAETRDVARMEDVNVRGSQRLLEWSIAQSAGQFVYVSSVGVYGPRSAGVVTPASDHRPANEYERTKDAAERLVSAPRAGGDMPVTILQPSNVFGTGPGWGHPLLGFIRSIAGGRFRYIGRKPAVFNYVDVRDVAAAAVAVLCPAAYERTFIVNDAISLADAVGVVARAADVPAPTSRIPYSVARVAADACDALARVTGRRFPLTIGRVSELTNRARYDGSEIGAALGFNYPIGTARGLSDLVCAYRKQALL